MEALRGRDYLPLCERLQAIVSRELDLIRASESRPRLSV
jgi:hypothetical protein